MEDIIQITFAFCVDILIILSGMMGISYAALNIAIFIIAMPLIIVIQGIINLVLIKRYLR